MTSGWTRTAAPGVSVPEKWFNKIPNTMKKLFTSLFMAIGLCGLAMAQTTSLTVQGEGYFSAKATVTLSADDKTAVEAADAIMFVTNTAQSAINSSRITGLYNPYAAGDIFYTGYFPSVTHHVIHTAKPALDEDNAAVLNLTTPAGLDAYLQLYTGKKTETSTGEGEDATVTVTWNYTLLATSTEKFQTKVSTIELSPATGSSLKAKIYLDDLLKKDVQDASTLLVVANPSMTTDVYHTQTTRYAVGDYTANQNGYGATKVVYHNKPTFTDDWCEIDVTGLTAGESGYLILCTGKEEDGAWTYSTGFLMSQEKYEISPLDITATEVEYASLKASVLMDETMAATYNASASLVALAAPYEAIPYLSIPTDRTIPFEVGEEMNGNPVVFVGKPALTADNKLEFTCSNLTPGAKVYLNFFLCFEADGVYSFDNKFFAHAQTAAVMKSIAAPAGLTVAPIQNGELPMTIEVDKDFSTMIVKSPSAQTINPKGKLTVGDTWDNYIKNLNLSTEPPTLERILKNSGTVVALLAPGVKTYNLKMEAGEACYVHVYAVANPETDAAAYASDMVMAPLYRMAEKLPLSYTFSANDLIYSSADFDTLPILPPGLSTTAVLPEIPEETADNGQAVEEAYALRQEMIASAFFIKRLAAFGSEDQYLLWSSYPSSVEDEFGPGMLAENEDTEQTPELRWIDWVTPEFSGVSLVQARFKTMMLGPNSQGGESPRKVAEGDEVRVEYSLNGGAWTAVQTFAAADFPAQEGSVYNLTVDFKCKPTDVVRIRYSYRSSVNHSHLAVASYEIVEGRSCAAPAELKAIADRITGNEIALSWQNQNVDNPESYMVYYENAAVPTANGSVSAKAMEATVGDLLPNTTYNVRVQAVCGRNDSSFFSAPFSIATAKGMPYYESMAPEIAMEGFGWNMQLILVSKPDLTVYAAADLEKPKTEWHEVEYAHVSPSDMELAQMTMSWNTFWCPENILFNGMGNFYSMGIHTKADMALMTTPVIHVPEAATPQPMTLTFKANPWAMEEDQYGPYFESNADLPGDIRLYVLASTDGFATWDTVAEFDHTDLYDENAAGDPGIDIFNDGYLPDMGIGDESEGYSGPGKSMTVKLDNYQGTLQLGFYFRSPVSSTDESDQAFLEIHSVSLDYDQRPQPYDLAAAATEIAEDSAVIRWKSDGDLYRVYYALNSAEKYTDSVDVEAAPGTMNQSVILRDLNPNTAYKVGVVSYSAGYTKASAMATTTFTTLERMYTVTATVTPEGAGTVTGDGRYFLGRTAKLTATPNEGYMFAAWKAGETEISTQATLEINVTKDTTVTAVFEEIPAEIPTYTLTLTAQPAEGGKVEGAGPFEAEADVTITATANEGYKFVAWKAGETEVSTQAEYTFKMPAADTAFTAVFEKLSANEDLLRAAFRLSAADGQLYVRNLKGITITDIDVHTLNGQRIHRFLPQSNEDLILPVDARRAILFIRLNSVEGVAIYKVYMQ